MVHTAHRQRQGQVGPPENKETYTYTKLRTMLGTPPWLLIRSPESERPPHRPEPRTLHHHSPSIKYDGISKHRIYLASPGVKIIFLLLSGQQDTSLRDTVSDPPTSLPPIPIAPNTVVQLNKAFLDITKNNKTVSPSLHFPSSAKSIKCYLSIAKLISFQIAASF